MNTIKPVNLIPYQAPPPSIMERHVRWLRAESEGIQKISKICLAVLEALICVVSVVGIKILFDAVHLHQKISSEETFYLTVASKRPPREDERLIFKSRTRSFNHVTEFALEDGILWARKIGSNPWSPLYFDGTNPEWIDCDGANLIVIDQERKLHYKKVLREYRAAAIRAAEDLTIDKTFKNNWKDHWFSLPYLSGLVNFFAGKRLTIPEGIKSIAISHRGGYNNFVEDRDGNRHPVGPGVTTLYLLDQSGRVIYKQDPWSPIWSKIYIPLPETSSTVYEAEKISASASTLMAIGYETNLTTKEKQLKIVTRLADIDTEGGNPGLKYDFHPNPNPKVRILPTDPVWKEHPLPQDASVTGTITILQTGEGNSARELRIEGKNGSGLWGYYRKNIADTAWEFVRVKDDAGRESFLLPSQKPLAPIETTVVDTGALLNRTHAVRLKNFGPHATLSEMELQHEGKTYQLPIYKRPSWINFLGISGDRYDLVVPEEAGSSLSSIFGKRKSLPIYFKNTQTVSATA